jgi:hypothetical protein
MCALEQSFLEQEYFIMVMNGNTQQQFKKEKEKVFFLNFQE